MPIGGDRTTPNIFYKLYPNEEVLLQPDTFIRAGSLVLLCERFLSGAVSKCGHRPKQEDTFSLYQDLNIHQVLKASLFSVIDGHGGRWCSQYLRCEMVPRLVALLSEDLSASED